MSDLPSTTRAQTLFLRAFHNHPDGPPPHDWPTPSVLRRWLKRPGFRRALATLRRALKVQHRLKLLLIARTADTALRAGITNTPMPTPPDQQPNEQSDLAKEKEKQSPPPVSELQRRLCKDLFTALRPRPNRRRRPIVIAPPKFDDCLQFLERQKPNMLLCDALLLYKDQYALAQEEENQRLLRARPSLRSRLLEQQQA